MNDLIFHKDCVCNIKNSIICFIQCIYRCNKSNIKYNKKNCKKKTKQNQSKLKLIRNIPFYIILQFISSWFYIIIIYEKKCYINKKIFNNILLFILQILIYFLFELSCPLPHLPCSY